ncbi:MAG: 23S rRNA (uracil(1939)-C(5))-methyltransferase RlmD [Elusimicrobiota bacterium]
MESIGQELELSIERPAPEGQFIGRAADSGRIFFVPYACPGERLLARVDKIEKGYACAVPVRVLSPGPGRREPPCPLHFRPEGRGPVCGGCSWQHLDEESQLCAKTAVVRDCVRRIGKLDENLVAQALPSPKAWRYRNKVLIPFGAGEDGRAIAGFFAPGTNRIADLSDCLVQPELSVSIALRVKELCAELGWTPYDVRGHCGWLRHLLVRTNEDGYALVALITNDDSAPRKEDFIRIIASEFPAVRGILQNVQPHRTSVALGETWIPWWGDSHLEERLGDLRLCAAAAAFLQVNTPASLVLYGCARRALEQFAPKPKLLLDLYSGVGSIALFLAGCADRVLGVEENRRAVEDARENARLNGIKNVEFIPGRVETSLGRLRATLAKLPAASAAVVLDPPRAGCASAVLDCLRDPALGKVIYISCNPATFARDAARLCGGGWRLSVVQPVDLFPQTSHIETAAIFDRISS